MKNILALTCVFLLILCCIFFIYSISLYQDKKKTTEALSQEKSLVIEDLNNLKDEYDKAILEGNTANEEIVKMRTQIQDYIDSLNTFKLNTQRFFEVSERANLFLMERKAFIYTNRFPEPYPNPTDSRVLDPKFFGDCKNLDEVNSIISKGICNENGCNDIYYTFRNDGYARLIKSSKIEQSSRGFIEDLWHDLTSNATNSSVVLVFIVSQNMDYCKDCTKDPPDVALLEELELSKNSILSPKIATIEYNDDYQVHAFIYQKNTYVNGEKVILSRFNEDKILIDEYLHSVDFFEKIKNE